MRRLNCQDLLQTDVPRCPGEEAGSENVAPTVVKPGQSLYSARLCGAIRRCSAGRRIATKWLLRSISLVLPCGESKEASCSSPFKGDPVDQWIKLILGRLQTKSQLKESRALLLSLGVLYDLEAPTGVSGRERKCIIFGRFFCLHSTGRP